MLNISKNTIQHLLNSSVYKSLQITAETSLKRRTKWIAFFLFVALFIIAVLPWTQNIQSKGQVTALNPGQRPQTIHSLIPGRIEQWLVQEGQLVQKGDTIAILSEVKDQYFNPDLVENYENQKTAKEYSVSSYNQKVAALDQQIVALTQNLALKQQELENKIIQANNKITADSIDLEAYKTNLQIAQDQLKRTEELHADGLKSLTDLEAKRLKVQESLAKKISQENKLSIAKNEKLNAQIQLNNIDNEYADKIAKAQSDKFASLSSKYEAETQVIKLENDVTNYTFRSKQYVVLAPQDGYITQANITGIGEIIKEGQALISIMPYQADMAVELYVKPMDIPLLHVGNKVRLQFDGWPALMFSGWQGVSFGTFGGTVVAINQFANDKNEYRVLVVPDENDVPWPKSVRVGGGAYGIFMLKNVPVYYEIWRQINGFPPEFYTKESTDKSQKEK